MQQVPEFAILLVYAGEEGQEGEVPMREMLLHLEHPVEDGQDVVLKLYALCELEHVEYRPNRIDDAWLLLQVSGFIGNIA